MKTVKLSKETILDIFNHSTNYVEVILGLFKAVTPWDDIEVFNSYPLVNEATWKFICEEGNSRYGLDFGLNWMNKGFSGTKHIKEWTVQIPNNCYTLNVKSVDSLTLADQTAAYAKIEIEELGSEQDYSYEERAMRANAD